MVVLVAALLFRDLALTGIVPGASIIMGWGRDSYCYSGCLRMIKQGISTVRVADLALLRSRVPADALPSSTGGDVYIYTYLYCKNSGYCVGVI
jgi:hypothetical protein